MNSLIHILMDTFGDCSGVCSAEHSTRVSCVTLCVSGKHLLLDSQPVQKLEGKEQNDKQIFRKRTDIAHHSLDAEI